MIWYDLTENLPWLAPLLPLLSLAVLAFTVWMIVDCLRNGRDWYWIVLMLIFWGLGAIIYFFVHKWGETSFEQGLAGRQATREQIRDLEMKIHHLDKADHYAELADIYREKRDWERARELYQAALERDPDLFEARVHLGYVLLARGQADAAWPLFEAAIPEKPAFEYGELLWQAARCQVARNRLAEARQLYEQLLASHTYSKARLEFAGLLDRLGESERSTEVLKQLVSEARHVPKFQRRREAKWTRQAQRLLRSRGERV